MDFGKTNKEKSFDDEGRVGARRGAHSVKDCKVNFWESGIEAPTIRKEYFHTGYKIHISKAPCSRSDDPASVRVT